MDHDSLLSGMLDRGIFAILRTPSDSGLIEVAAAILNAGISAIEITLTIPNGLDVIRDLCKEFGDRLLIGAGTVLNAETARAAIDAGAQFIVAPTFLPETIETTRQLGKVSIPGAFSPTEILSAWNCGADIVKVFPSEVIGPKFFEAVRRPLPSIRLAATGNIDCASAKAFLTAGSCVIGIGGPLSDHTVIAAKRFDEIGRRTSEYVEMLRRHRAEAASCL